MPDINAVNKIKGKYAVLTVVTDYNTADEAETIVEAANDEVTVDPDEELLESDSQLGVEITQREVVAGAPLIEVGALLTPDNEALNAVGITDADGNWTTAGRTIEAVRLRFYASSDLASLDLVIDGVDVEPQWSDSAGFPSDDYGSTGLTFHCNDGITFETTDLDTNFSLS